MPVDGPSRFKSRFSHLSLLPPRHPPLEISDPLPPIPALPQARPLDSIAQPQLPSHAHALLSHAQPQHHLHPLVGTRQVEARHPTLVSRSSTIFSPAHSEYPDTSTPKSPPLLPPFEGPIPKRPARPNDRHDKKATRQSSLPPPESSTSVGSSSKYSPSPPRRPPPLDLSKTLEAYPGVSGVVATAETAGPVPKRKEPRRGGWFGLSQPKEITEKEHEAPKKVEKDDPFDVCELGEHRYPSWKQGRVSIRPGQVIPQGTFSTGTPTIRGEDSKSFHLQPPPAGRRPSGYSPEHDSVLHNVLLTPTYLASPEKQSHTTREERRKTLLDRVGDVVRDTSTKWTGKSILKRPEESADRVVREMREREMRDMARFRQTQPYDTPPPLVLPRQVVYVSSTPHRSTDYLYQRKSPGEEEWNMGSKGGRERRYKGQDEKASNGWFCLRRKKKKESKKKNMYRWVITIVIIVLAALTIGLCTTLLTQSGDSEQSSSSSNTTIPTNQTTPIDPNDSTSPTSKSLTTCLDQFTSSASLSPGSYACSDCVPLLTSATNDFTQTLVGPNSTGVGAALQFCAMMDVLKVSSGLGNSGWGKDASPCGWSGVACDTRGRITELALKYPNVPSTVPASLGNVVSLSTLRLLGNNTVPAGEFPSAILSLSNLTIFDLEYTALRGDLSSMDFGKLSQLSSVILVNNVNLAPRMPDLSKNAALKTLAITGQKLGTLEEAKLPLSVNYLDLAYNNFTGQIPALSSLTSLNTLYLTNNDFASLPASFPESISSLQLTSNPTLSGSMPSSLCSNPNLTNCDLRSTKLMGPPVDQSSSSSLSASASGSRSTTSTSTSFVPVASSTVGACGVCRFF